MPLKLPTLPSRCGSPPSRRTSSTRPASTFLKRKYLLGRPILLTLKKCSDDVPCRSPVARPLRTRSVTGWMATRTSRTPTLSATSPVSSLFPLADSMKLTHISVYFLFSDGVTHVPRPEGTILSPDFSSKEYMSSVLTASLSLSHQISPSCQPSTSASSSSPPRSSASTRPSTCPLQRTPSRSLLSERAPLLPKMANRRVVSRRSTGRREVAVSPRDTL